MPGDEKFDKSFGNLFGRLEGVDVGKTVDVVYRQVIDFCGCCRVLRDGGRLHFIYNVITVSIFKP